MSGTYRFEPDGGLRGEFTGNILGKLAGTFVFRTGNAEVCITAKPFLLPKSVLKSKLSGAMTEALARFPAAG